MYKVIKEFTERFDGNHLYKVGDVYPNGKFVAPEGRSEALCVAKTCELNRTGNVYLKKEPKKVKEQE